MRLTSKYLEDRYRVAFWREYNVMHKREVWVCVDKESYDFICSYPTLKEIENFLKVRRR